MKIRELRATLNNIPNTLDDLEVWIDTDESEGGRPVEEVNLRFADDCCLDGDDMGDEILYEDEVMKLLGIDTLPDDKTSMEFANILSRMSELSYRWGGGNRFSKRILAIKF